MTKVFIDGSAGTTGLQIVTRLQQRQDLQLLTLPEDLRKDPQARQDALHSADIAFLCLPDAAAKESARLARGSSATIIDTSTAHRVDPDWVYGFPELTGKRQAIGSARRIANPGCHASGFIALVAPLVEAGLLKADSYLTCTSLTGYSGGGKGMIAQYEAADRDALLAAPRMYGLTQQHKHLPEMQQLCGLANTPVFCPIVDPFFSGMEVIVPVFAHQLTCPADALPEFYRAYYRSGVVRYTEDTENGFLSAARLSGTDSMHITVQGNGERILLISRFDNLGKGASGAAIQNMNIALGLEETLGLNLI